MNIFQRLRNLEENQLILTQAIEKMMGLIQVEKAIDEKRIFTDNVPAFQKEYVEERLRVKGDK